MATARRSQAEYQRRLHAVIDHVDRHIDRDLELRELAAVAHFSEFHFHRLFHALTGDALGDYVRRRRLEWAAIRLRSQPAAPVLDIALGVGFGSGEALARAFRARFGCSPTEWRKRKHGKASRKPGQETAIARRKNGRTSKQERAMKVKLVDRGPVSVAYLRYQGLFGEPLGRWWQETVAPWMTTNNLFGRERFGISLDDPTVTQPTQCRYDACVASPEGEVLSGNPQRKIIEGGKYAALEFYGTSGEIGNAWERLLREWLPKSGLQLDSRPFFEYYPVDGRMDPKTGAFSCEICVPVAEL